MIEIVFSESACGSLKMAQHYGGGKYQSGGISVIISHPDGRKPTRKEISDAQRKSRESARLEWESAVPLGGNAEDVLEFNMALSMGDISQNEPGAQRQRVLENLYVFYPNDEGRLAAQELLRRARDNLKTVCARAAQGEPIRIWYSDQPDELCGLYWLMAQLLQFDGRCGRVYVVKLPEWEADDKGQIITMEGWGEAAPKDWSRFLTLQRIATSQFRRDCASHWHTLQKENAPLRAMLNGRLVSVPKTIYDDFILREIAAQGEEFQEARIIGLVLGKYRLGISDCWVALRIEEMISAGILAAVSAPLKDTPAYHRVLKKRIEL